MYVKERTAETEIAIETSKLTKYYGNICAVDHLDLKVSRGTIHGLIGPNGAGKTTVIKMLCGVTNPALGEAYILGFNVRDEPEKAKAQVGYIPENPMAYETLTVDEFLNFIGALYLILGDELQKKKQKYIELFNLEAYKGEYIGSLSKGFLQRTIICSIMIREPQVFLLDEPFYGLDPYSSWQFKRLLREMRENGKTVLICTHALGVVEELCDGITIMNKGKKVAEGPTQDLRKNAGSNFSLEEAFLKLTEGINGF